jgi:hypothetical protein
MRLVRCALAALLLTGAGTVGVAASPAAAASCAGVWVVVDFGDLGGSDTACADGDPKTGIAALTSAGHSIAYVPGKGPMVCSIDGRPHCKGVPPTDAYWSYWYRAPGASSWTYSTRGAHARDPEPGSAEGWSFGDASQPPPAPPAQDVAEPSPPPAKPKPKPTRTPRPQQTTAQQPRDGGAQPPPATRPARRTPSTTTPRQSDVASVAPTEVATAPAAATATAVPSTSSTPVATGTPVAAASAAATGKATPTEPEATTAPRTEPLASSSSEGGGTPVPALIGVVLIVGLGALGTWLARRRTQS